ncbi:ABC transporter permease [Candidatus Woesearchaeota archaeon]|nr:ABC transporter permease [Candidatus Woesearchaeota archaeon]
MRLHKVFALLYRDLLIIRRSRWRVVELIYFPLTTVLIWGFFSVYSRRFSVEAGLIILIINIFWNFAFVAQSTANMQIMEDVWSGSLKQLLVSGISEVEYMVGRMITASIVSSIILALMVLTSLLFSSQQLYFNQQFIVISILTLLVSLAMAVLVSAMIVSLGKSYGFLAWSALQAFVFLSAPFFPKETFPGVISAVSAVMPYTYIFESARALSYGESMPLMAAFITVVAYSVLVWPIYIYLFRKARKNGNLVRLG